MDKIWFRIACGRGSVDWKCKNSYWWNWVWDVGKVGISVSTWKLEGTFLH